MKEKIDAILSEAKEKLSSIDNLNELNNLKVGYLGKKGIITGLLKSLKDVALSERPQIGKVINELREEITGLIDNAEAALKNKQKNILLSKEEIDITLSNIGNMSGGLHPVTLARQELVNAFIGMGFSVAEGPEIETDYYNFQQLNIPKDHPARDMQDTFYINPNILLRTHTSPVQARTMEGNTPPIRIICPGKVYRSDDDATHSPMFQQIEGLYVDKGVNIRDLTGCLDAFAKSFFGEQTKIRLRPSYFPFTEPSVEVDVSCSMCQGKGCRLCKGTGWIEVLGAGIVNPKVLKASGINPEIYTGFAFGVGIERCAMIKYGIPDMRILFENDIRYLRQYK